MIAWLEAIGIKAFLEWIFDKVMNVIRKYQKDKANHEKAVDQAKQDNEKASHINDGSSSNDIDAATDDSLKHL